MLKTLPALLFIIATTCHAEAISIEDAGLEKLPKEIESIIYADQSFSSFKQCSIVGKATKISTTKEASVFFATTAHGCNWGAALGPIWLVSAEPGAETLILASGGYSINIDAPKHYGMHDLSVISGTAGLPSKREFKFNGTQYIATPN